MADNRFALIIAGNEYEDDRFQKLIAPAQDADALAKVLSDPAIGGFEVQTLVNEPSYKVNREIETFFANRHRDDLLAVYFSCHGIKGEDGRLYYAMSDTQRDLLRSTTIPAMFVNDVMGGSRSRRQVLLLDCCYSGAFARGTTMKSESSLRVQSREQLEGRGRMVLTASDSMQYSFEEGEFEVEGEETLSVFTRALIEGLESGEADTDGDGRVSLDELYDYVYNRVTETNPRMTPSKWAIDMQGDLIFASNPRPLIGVELPTHLLQAIASEFPRVREDAIEELTRLMRGSHLGFALVAKETLERMSEEDDSRRVSAYAAEMLKEHGENVLAQPSPPPSQPAPARVRESTRADEPARKLITPETEFRFVRKWGGVGHGDGQFQWANSVAVDQSGNVYVADSTNHKIQVFNSQGVFVSKWGSAGNGNGQFQNPYGVAVGPSGNVYVADSTNHRIQVFNSQGVFVSKWGSAGNGNGQFEGPYNIAIDQSGNLYVSELYNDRIQVLNSQGVFVSKWGSAGNGNGQFQNPYGIAISQSGSIYVADSSNNRIQVFNSEGKFLTKWGAKGSRDGFFNYPDAIAIDEASNIYVADSSNNRIQVFNSEGKFLTKWGTEGSGDGLFYAPNGLAIDESGNLYVADRGNNRIQVFEPVNPPNA